MSTHAKVQRPLQRSVTIAQRHGRTALITTGQLLGRNPQLRAVGQFLARHQFATAITGAIALAAVMTVFNIALYQASVVSELDFSRPGFERVREQVRADEVSTRIFSPTGPVDEASLNEFQELYTNEKRDLQNSSSYRSDELSDDSLRLSEQSPPAESTTTD